MPKCGMTQDVVDLRSFYGSPLGEVARRLILRLVRARWEDCTGLSMLGLGYPTPYLDLFRAEAMRTLAFMPAEQGVVHWPPTGPSSTALVETGTLPLPDSCIDRVILAHSLETAEHPHELLGEIWRILTPGGRLILIVPNRRGVWARRDTTPFGIGQPFSRGQLRELLRESLFSPLHFGEALYVPPVTHGLVLRGAAAFERFGARLGLPGGGVLVVEANKQLYRPVAVRRLARASARQLQPALLPGAIVPTGTIPAAGAQRESVS